MEATAPASRGLLHRPERILGHHDAHPAILASLAAKQFGTDWLEWEPDVLWFEIQKELGATLSAFTGRRVNASISNLNRNKLQAVRTMILSNGFWDAWEVFTPVLQALNNNIPIFNVLQKPSVAQLMAGLDMVPLLRGGREFSDEVARYVAACCLDEGVWLLPGPLQFAQMHAARPYYKCLECGNEDEIDPEDPRCDSCSGKFSADWDSHALNLRPARGMEGEGLKIETHLRNDPSGPAARWAQIKEAPADDVELLEVPSDIVCAKLLVARDYMTLRQRQYAEQKEALQPLLAE